MASNAQTRWQFRAVLKSFALTAAVCPLLAQPTLAQPGGGRYSGWGHDAADRWPASRPAVPRTTSTPDPREGKVEVTRFIAQDGAAMLKPGPIDIVVSDGENETRRAVYEAALVDRLVRAGFDTMTPADEDGRVIEMRVVRDTLIPAEAKRNPVSGTAAVGVSNRGSMVGMAVNVDLTDPKKALLSTRLDLKIRASSGGPVLWEGYATLATRDEDENWGEADIAARLADALFDGFPLSASVVDAPVG